MTYRCIQSHTDHGHTEHSHKHNQHQRPHHVPSLADQGESLSVQNIHVFIKYGSPGSWAQTLSLPSSCLRIPVSPTLLAPGRRRCWGCSPAPGELQGYRHLARTISLTHTHTRVDSNSTGQSYSHTAGCFITISLSFPMFDSPKPLWSLPLPPFFFFSSPKQHIISPIQSQNTLPVHPIRCPWAVTALCPWGAPERSSRDSPWWGDALPGQPWKDPSRDTFLPWSYLGAPPASPLLCSVLLRVCGNELFISQPDKYLLSVRFFCCLGRSFSVSEAHKLCHTLYMKSIGVSKPFPFIFLKNVRLRLKE